MCNNRRTGRIITIVGALALFVLLAVLSSGAFAEQVVAGENETKSVDDNSVINHDGVPLVMTTGRSADITIGSSVDMSTTGAWAYAVYAMGDDSAINIGQGSHNKYYREIRPRPYRLG